MEQRKRSKPLITLAYIGSNTSYTSRLTARFCIGLAESVAMIVLIKMSYQLKSQYVFLPFDSVITTFLRSVSIWTEYTFGKISVPEKL